MSPPRHNSSAENPPSRARAGAQVAHELANLLDAGMRHAALAMADLPASPSGVGAARRLELSRGAMQEMAVLLKRWMRTAETPCAGTPSDARLLHERDETVSHAVARSLRLLSAEAAQRGISLSARISLDAATVPAGPLGTVLINGIRNSLAAIGGAPGAVGGEIEVSVIVDAAELVLSIRDSGPAGGLATSPAHESHGLGLDLCRQIAQDLGGELELVHRQPGAELTLRAPLAALRGAAGRAA